MVLLRSLTMGVWIWLCFKGHTFAYGTFWSETYRLWLTLSLSHSPPLTGCLLLTSIHPEKKSAEHVKICDRLICSHTHLYSELVPISALCCFSGHLDCRGKEMSPSKALLTVPYRKESLLADYIFLCGVSNLRCFSFTNTKWQCFPVPPPSSSLSAVLPLHLPQVESNGNDSITYRWRESVVWNDRWSFHDISGAVCHMTLLFAAGCFQWSLKSLHGKLLLMCVSFSKTEILHFLDFAFWKMSFFSLLFLTSWF